MRAKPIPVCIDERIARRLERAALRLGITRSAVMRLAIVNQLTQIERGVIKIATPQDAVA
jgi:hypothetical protein